MFISFINQFIVFYIFDKKLQQMFIQLKFWFVKYLNILFLNNFCYFIFDDSFKSNVNLIYYFLFYKNLFFYHHWFFNMEQKLLKKKKWYIYFLAIFYKLNITFLLFQHETFFIFKIIQKLKKIQIFSNLYLICCSKLFSKNFFFIWFFLQFLLFFFFIKINIQKKKNLFLFLQASQLSKNLIKSYN